MNFLSIATVMALGITFYNVDSEVRTNMEQVEEENQYKRTIDKTIINQNKMLYDNANNRYYVSNKLATADDKTLNIMRKVDAYLENNKMNLINYNNTGNKITSSQLCSKVFTLSQQIIDCENILSKNYNFIVSNKNGTSSFIVDNKNSNINLDNDLLNGGLSSVTKNENGEIVVTTKSLEDTSLKTVSDSMIDGDNKIFKFNANDQIIKESETVSNVSDLNVVEKVVSVANSDTVKELATVNTLNNNNLKDSSIRTTTVLGSQTNDSTVIISKLNQLLADWNNCILSSSQEILDNESKIRTYLGDSVYQNWLNKKYTVEATCYAAELKKIDTTVTNTEKLEETAVVIGATAKEEAKEIIKLINKSEFDKLFITKNLSVSQVKDKIVLGLGREFYTKIEKDYINNAKRFFYNSSISTYNDFTEYSKKAIGKTSEVINYDSFNLDNLIYSARNKVLTEKATAINTDRTYINQNNFDSKTGVLFDPTKVTNTLNTTTISNGSGSYNTVD